MATRVFADEELERLRGFPEISREGLFRYFTLTPADLGFVDPGRGRGPADRLGLAVTLCTVPWLGFVADRLTTAPPVAVARSAEQLRVDPVEIGSYGRRAKTRTEHVRLAAQYLGWRPAGTMEFKELEEFLLARAMEHDSPTLLFRLACEYLISARVIRPGPSRDLRPVGSRVHPAALRGAGCVAGCRSVDRGVAVAVAVDRAGGGVGVGGEGRGRQAGVSAQPGCRHGGPVGVARGAAPVSGYDGRAPDPALPNGGCATNSPNAVSPERTVRFCWTSCWRSSTTR